MCINLPMFDQAKIYSNADSSVHLYNFNLDLEYDWLTTRELTEVKSTVIKLTERQEFLDLSQGIGYSGELPYIFGATENWKYGSIMDGRQPQEWENDLTELLQNEWSSIIKNAAPSWGEYDEEDNTWWVENSDNNIQTSQKSGLTETLKFWLEKYQ